MAGAADRDRKGKGKAKPPPEEDEAEDEPMEEEEEDDDDDDERPVKKKRKSASGKAAKPVAGKGGARKSSGGGAGPSSAAAHPAVAVDVAAEDDVLNVQSLVNTYTTEAEELCKHAQVVAVSQDDRDMLVGNVMRLLLFRQYKDGAPVSRSDLNSVVYANFPKKQALAAAVVALAQARFLASLGLHMKELDKAKRTEALTDVKKRVAAAAAGDKSTKVFVLRSALPLALRAKVDTQRDITVQGFTLAVLALVHLAGDSGLPEAKLHSHLAQLGVQLAGGDRHPQLGDAGELLASLVKQRYLQRNKAATSAGEQWVLELAENGLDEVGTPPLDAWVKTLVTSSAVLVVDSDGDE